MCAWQGVQQAHGRISQLQDENRTLRARLAALEKGDGAAPGTQVSLLWAHTPTSRVILIAGTRSHHSNHDHTCLMLPQGTGLPLNSVIHAFDYHPACVHVTSVVAPSLSP
jgi:hypothetical protein